LRFDEERNIAEKYDREKGYDLMAISWKKPCSLWSSIFAGKDAPVCWAYRKYLSCEILSTYFRGS
jgi:hypothetical protein